MILKIIDKLINMVIFIIMIFFLSLSFYYSYDSYKIYNDVKVSIDFSDINIDDNKDFIKLRKINKDIIGWIRIDGTIIDYPILQAGDNKKYLTTNYKKEYSSSGSIFLDYRNNANFEDDFSIIYGHNMSYKAMFAELKEYKNSSFFNSHKQGKLYLEDKTYDIEILLYKVIGTYDDIPYNLYLYRNNHNELIYKALSSKEEKHDKLLLLSTCSSGNKNKRVVLLAEIRSFT